MSTTITQTANKPAQACSPWSFALVSPALLAPVWIVSIPEAVPFLSTICGMLLVLVLGMSSYTDARWRLIPNWATYSCFSWVITLNLFAAIAKSIDPTTRHLNATLGTVGLQASLAGAGACFAVMFTMYIFNLGGAGDVKLAAVIGAAFGFRLSMQAILWSYIAAGVAVFCYLLLRYGASRVARLFCAGAGSTLAPLWFVPPTSGEKQILKQPVPLAVFFTIGTTIVLAKEYLL